MYYLLSDKTISYSMEIARVTMGIDALYRREAGIDDLHDGLVVLNMCDVAPEPFEDYTQAQQRLAELAGRALGLPEPDRRLYYTQACTSLWSFCQWRRGLLEDIGTQIGMFLHVDPASPSEAQLQAWNRDLYRLLGEAGYAGDLKARIDAWEQKHLVPPDEVQGTMDEMMVFARERTGNILELPENDYYHCQTVPSAAFNASSDYGNRRVIVNTAPILTTHKLKHLVCHEVYPGHFMQFTLRRIAWERGYGGLDGTLSVCNHSSSCTFEGIADCGAAFLDWEEDIDDAINGRISMIQSALGAAASYRMHILKRPNAEVEAFLRDNAPGGGEGWVANRMGFISDPARAALIWSYLRGDEGVFPVWARVAREDRPAFFEYIYNRLHTVQSLQLFGREA